MPRFVILRHELPADSKQADHYDLMLETAEGLLTWQIEHPLDSDSDQPAEELPLHRKHYLDYEGEVSNNRGHVKRIASGTFLWQTQAGDFLEVQLQGEQIQGQLTLTRQSGPAHSAAASAPSSRWRASFSSTASS